MQLSPVTVFLELLLSSFEEFPARQRIPQKAAFKVAAAAIPNICFSSGGDGQMKVAVKCVINSISADSPDDHVNLRQSISHGRNSSGSRPSDANFLSQRSLLLLPA